jgi:putative salt-induced outer membrane protein YdiY
MRSALIVICALAWPALACADHLTLKNGDSLTGTVLENTSQGVTLQSQLAGRVTVDWDNVSALTGADGRDVARPTSRTWESSFNAGFDMSRGNSETANLSTSVTSTRTTDRDRLNLFGSYAFSNVGTGTDSITTARATRGGFRYDHDIVGRVFGFGFANAENDPIQLLDLRTVEGGGAGLHVVKNDRTQFNLTSGLSYARDKYADVTNVTTTTTTSQIVPLGKSGKYRTRTTTTTSTEQVRTERHRNVTEYLFGEDVNSQLSDRVNLTEELTLYPAINQPSDYRIYFETTLSTQISPWLDWNITAADRFLNIPPSGGAVRNDTYVTMGLGVNLHREATKKQ